MHSASGAPKAVANGILLYQCSETPTKQAIRLFRFFMAAVARRVEHLCAVAFSLAGSLDSFHHAVLMLPLRFDLSKTTPVRRMSSLR